MTQRARIFLVQSIMGALFVFGALTLGGCQGDSSAIKGQTWVPDFQITPGPNVTVDASAPVDGGVTDDAQLDAQTQASDSSTPDVGVITAADMDIPGDAMAVDAGMSDAQGMSADAQGMSADAQQRIADAQSSPGDALIPTAADGSAAAIDGGL